MKKLITKDTKFTSDKHSKDYCKAIKNEGVTPIIFTKFNLETSLLKLEYFE